MASPAYNYNQIQIVKMKSCYPHFKSYTDQHRLFFTGVVQPSSTMPQYKIRIEYRKDQMPKVKVMDPALLPNRPHYYKKQDCLCLYKPEDFYWSASLPISEYIVSWATCWLYFYEVWKETGTWYGPEASHEKNNLKE